MGHSHHSSNSFNSIDFVSIIGNNLKNAGSVWLRSILVFGFAVHLVKAGMCWTAPNSAGRCTDLISSNVDHDECCSTDMSRFAGVATAGYSPDDLKSGQLFYYRALRGGVPCQPCKVTCEGVRCGPGKRCVVKQQRQQKNQNQHQQEQGPEKSRHRRDDSGPAPTGDHFLEAAPTCVCAPRCSRRKRRLGPVCGSDGHTYQNRCRLLKRKCRKNSSLSVAYPGPCQDSCKNVRCPGKKTCVVDQNHQPHCVRCDEKCAFYTYLRYFTSN